MFLLAFRRLLLRYFCSCCGCLPTPTVTLPPRFQAKGVLAAASDAPSTLAILLEHISSCALAARVRLNATAPRVHPLAPRHVLSLVHHRLVHAHRVPGLAALVDAAKEVAAAGGPDAPPTALHPSLRDLIAQGPRYAREAPLAPKALDTLTGMVVDNFVCVFCVCVCVCVCVWCATR